MEDQDQTSPNQREYTKQSDARLLTENKVNNIIADLIEKTKILAEELKNSNKIASELMVQNSELRNKYTTLKDKFLQFLNDEEIVEYMESDQNLSQQNSLITKLKQYDNQVQVLKNDNMNLDDLNQKLQKQIHEMQIQQQKTEKQSNENEILIMKDHEILSLQQQLQLMQQQIHDFLAEQSKIQVQQSPQNQLNQQKQNNKNQNIPNKGRALSQMSVASSTNNQSQYGSIPKKQQQQQSSTQKAQSIQGQQAYWTQQLESANHITPQVSNHPSLSSLEVTGLNNLRRPLSQKNLYFNKNLNFDYNELLYSEQPNEFEDQDIYQHTQQGQEEMNKNAGYNQNQYYSNGRQQQQQKQNQGFHTQQSSNHHTNNTNQKQFTYQDNQENNGSFENNQPNPNNDSNHLIINGGAGKSLIDPYKQFGRHQKSPLYMDPQQAAKYARSSALKKGPIQKSPGLLSAIPKRK